MWPLSPARGSAAWMAPGAFILSYSLYLSVICLIHFGIDMLCYIIIVCCIIVRLCYCVYLLFYLLFVSLTYRYLCVCYFFMFSFYGAWTVFEKVTPESEKFLAPTMKPASTIR